jgi:16S rRNA (adenine1518-N6/adenine1519-N6)-dimethyltransferase
LAVETQVIRKAEYRKYHPSEVLLLSQTKRLLRRFELKARKSLGQHFLIDDEVLQAVATAAELSASDIVMEIGPGLGVLTKELAKRAGRVISVELDSPLASVLGQTLASLENVTVVEGDILKFEPAALLGGQETANYKVVANLPYYITSAVLRHFLEAKLKPQVMVVMVQKEVAEAIVAKPGRMSLLSVSVQFYGEPEIVSYVPAGCFYPPPEVSSAILKVALYHQPVVAKDSEGFFQLVRAGFCASRKQLANSLSQGMGLPKARVLSLLEKACIIPERRAETLTLIEWARLWQTYKG